MIGISIVSMIILLGVLIFAHEFGEEVDWILEAPRANEGTTVMMKLNNHSSRVLFMR